MSDEKIRWKIAYVIGRRKSRIVIEGKADDGETMIVRCTDGIGKFLAVFRVGEPLPQMYSRIE